MKTKLHRPMLQYVKDDNDNREITGVEIGVATGKNALNMLQNLDIDKLYLIDSYSFHPKKYSQHPFIIAKRNLKKYTDRIVWVRRRSEDAVDKIPVGIDFVYIDGNHRYKYVKLDIELYYPKIRTGGVIGGHDYVADYSGVVKAVQEFAGKHNLQLQSRETDWWLVKE